MLRPGSALPHLGDPALNAWILSWNLHALASHPFQIWDANIFFPYRLTLAYSENLLVPSLLLLPARAMTANPVALYHVSLMSGVFFSAIAAFALGYRLSGSFWAALVPGIAFAFCPFKLGHYGHLQMQHAAWIPLALMGFLAYRDRLEAGAPRRLPILAGIALSIFLQFASNMYFALFLTTALLMWQVLLLRGIRHEFRVTVLADAAVLWTLVAVLVLPLAVPYLLTQRDMGFGRNMQEIVAYSADAADYIRYNARNLWFGTRFPSAEEPEHSATPGIVLAILAALPLARSVAAGGWRQWFRRNRAYRRGLLVIDALLVIVLIMLVVVYVAGGIHIRYRGETVSVLGVKLTVENPTNSVALVLVLVVMRAFVAGWRPRLFAARPPSTRTLLWALLIFSVVMSFGPHIQLYGRDLCPGPYGLFHRFFPGFGGIRAPARYAVFVPLALGLLGAMNLASIRTGAGGARFALFIPLALIPLEFASFRVPLRHRYDPPPITAWLRQADPGGVFELRRGATAPGGPNDLPYILHSVKHWQHLFNGYSGHAPPVTVIGHHLLRSFPEEPCGALLNRLGIRYIVVHDCTSEVRDRCAELGFEYLAGAGGAYVFSPPAEADAPGDTGVPKPAPRIPQADWSVTAYPVRGNADRILKDGNPDTAWRSLDTQVAGMYFEVTFDPPSIATGMRLHFGAFGFEFPRSYRVKAMRPAGESWHTLESVYDPVAFVASALESPRNPALTIRFPAQRVSRLRFETTGRVPGFGLAVADLELLGVPRSAK